MAFYRLEPWGFDADNWRAALVAAMVANTVRDPKKRRKPYQPVDFMPDMDDADDGPAAGRQPAPLARNSRQRTVRNEGPEGHTVSKPTGGNYP